MILVTEWGVWRVGGPYLSGAFSVQLFGKSKSMGESDGCLIYRAVGPDKETVLKQ